MKKIIVSIVLFTSASIGFSQQNTLNPTGNVGVGTMNPTKALEVNGDTKISGRVDLDSIVIVKDSIIIEKDARVKQDLRVGGKLKITGNSRFVGNVNTLGVARFQNKAVFNGNVMMPNLSTAPTNSNFLNNGSILLQNANGKVIKAPLARITDIIYDAAIPCLTNSNGQQVPIWKNGFNKMYLECPGFLGLGTNDPQKRLHVVGDALITKNAFIEGFLKVGTNSLYIGTPAAVPGGSNNIWTDKVQERCGLLYECLKIDKNDKQQQINI